MRSCTMADVLSRKASISRATFERSESDSPNIASKSGVVESVVNRVVVRTLRSTYMTLQVALSMMAKCRQPVE